jgi:hypothetical protein
LGDGSLTKEARNFGLFFFRSTSYAFILTKIGWAKFLVIFSQTHLVTLDVANNTFGSLPILCQERKLVPNALGTPIQTNA